MTPTNVRFKSRRKYQVHPRTVVAPRLRTGRSAPFAGWDAHRASGGRRRSFNRLERGYHPDRAYKNSKLAVLWFTCELQHRLPASARHRQCCLPGLRARHGSRQHARCNALRDAARDDPHAVRDIRA
jgi:hypothetical protein